MSKVFEKRSSESREKRTRSLSIDRVVLITLILLSIALILLLIVGDRTVPRILNFSWEQQTVGRENDHFTLTFDRPMNWPSIQSHLKIVPSLPGKLSWTGQTLAYTLTDIPVYGTEYQILLQGAQEQPRKPGKAPQTLPFFQAKFPTRDRAFVYLGVQKEERGRLILYNLSRSQKYNLTPPDLVVTGFEPYSSGDQVLFAAFERGRNQDTQQLYTVTTGLRSDRAKSPTPAGRIQLILDSQAYQNLQFDLAPDGTIVIDRLNRQNPLDTGLWVMNEGRKPRSLGIQGKPFQIAGDSQRVAISQREGVRIVPLTSEGGEWEFFPEYEEVLGFSRRDGNRKIMTKENQDLTRSLFLVNNKGDERELLKTRGRVLQCEFEPRQETLLYCLTLGMQAGDPPQMQLILSIIDLMAAKDVPIVSIANDPNVRMSMAADGRELLFDRVFIVPTTQPNQKSPQITGSLWLLPLPDFFSNPGPVRLTPPREVVMGVNPKWLP